MDATTTGYELTKADFERLANLRYALRRFSRQSELEARTVGLTPQQHLLLLALKGYPGRDWANITELAERLQIRHNAVIGLVNRAEERGLVRREADLHSGDRRIVLVHITPEGERRLARMSIALRSERQRVLAALEAADQSDDQVDPSLGLVGGMGEGQMHRGPDTHLGR
jgi:DNA-binding MarR family transcriptional regulator